MCLSLCIFPIFPSIHRDMSAAYPLALICNHSFMYAISLVFIFCHSLFTIQTLFIVCSLPICPLFFSQSCCNCHSVIHVVYYQYVRCMHIFHVICSQVCLLISVCHSVTVYDLLVICMLTVGHPYIMHLLFIDSSSIRCLFTVHMSFVRCSPVFHSLFDRFLSIPRSVFPP